MKIEEFFVKVSSASGLVNPVDEKALIMVWKTSGALTELVVATAGTTEC